MEEEYAEELRAKERGEFKDNFLFNLPIVTYKEQEEYSRRLLGEWRT